MMHMQPSKSSWSLRLHQILIFILILSVSSCSGACGKGKGKKGGNTPVSILLVHGIGGCPGGVSNLTELKENLEKALVDGQGEAKKSNAKIFAPARENSMQASLTTQAREMVDFLEKQGITKKDKVVLIGNSQGGAIVLAMYAMFMKKDWKDVAVITIQGANEGTPGMIPNPTEHQKLIDKVLEIVGKIRTKFTGVSHLIPDNQKVTDSINGFLGWQTGDGGQDLVPDSPFMQDLLTQMPKSVPIPMLLLAGEVRDFSSCLIKMLTSVTMVFSAEFAGMLSKSLLEDTDINNALNTELKPIWNQLNSNGQPNDLLIPVSSQRGENLIKEGNRVTKKMWIDYGHSNQVPQQPLDEMVKFIKDFIKK